MPESVRQVAKDNGIAAADVYAIWEARAVRDEGDMTRYLVNGLNHPETAMHAIPAELIFFNILNDSLSNSQAI